MDASDSETRAFVGIGRFVCETLAYFVGAMLPEVVIDSDLPVDRAQRSLGRETFFKTCSIISRNVRGR
jgi:hypothetical protein